MVEIIELKDEYLVIKAINNQITPNIKKNNIFNANIYPNKQATPLPPLNFNQIGNMCPKIANKPQKAPILISIKYEPKKVGI